MTRKLKDPLGAFFRGVEAMRAAAMGEVEIIRESALTTKLGSFTVDTCNTVDKGWETGIEPQGKSWIIVESYEGESQAKEGHKKWVESLTKNPEQELKDINYTYEE